MPPVVTAMTWAELRIRRTSLKDGDTKRRDEMWRLLSWYLKAASSGNRVKKMPRGGTRSLSFDGKGFAGSFWWATARGVSHGFLEDGRAAGGAYCGRQS